MSNLKFSGHDTFHCREQWLLKGCQQVDSQGYKLGINSSHSIVDLGVGKNMVRAISHWMKSFGLLDKDNLLTDFSNLIFINNGFDPFLEDPGTLWLLQYHICHSDYASLYRLLFVDYFLDKASLEFSEQQLLSFINRKIDDNNQRPINDSTLSSDLKVLLKTYILPGKNTKTLEDDFNAPLQSLNLIIDSGRKKDNGDKVYIINKKNIQRDLSIEIFGFCVLNEFKHTDIISYDNLKTTVGAYLCLTNEGLVDIVESLCSLYHEFIFKEDSTVKQLQFKISDKEEFMNKLLKLHYSEN